LTSVVLPAWKASHLSPLEAMRDVLPEEIEGVQWWLVSLGVVMLLMGITVMIAGILGWISMIHTIWASTLVLFGLVFVLPIALQPLSTLTAIVLKPVFRVEGRLARLQLLRHRARTTLTVGVVFIAAATGIGLASSVTDTVNDVRKWYQKTIVADYFVRASAPDMASYSSADLPETVGAEIKKVEGIKNIDAVRLKNVKVAGETASLIARDHNEPGPPDLDLIAGDESDLRERLRNGEVALGSVLAQRGKFKVGDHISFETEKGEKKFRVAAIVNDYQAGGLTVHMERSVARLELGVEGVSAYAIKADHERLDEARKQLQAICDQYGLVLQTFSDIQKSIDVMMSGVVASLWAMVVLALLVSAVGVTNTLTINVLEQTRELGLLRIVAMTQAQVRKTVFTQAVIMALLALVPGIIAGVSVAYLINLSMMPVVGHGRRRVCRMVPVQPRRAA
jgi:putative ABC transport system permease protein